MHQMLKGSIKYVLFVEGTGSDFNLKVASVIAMYVYSSAIFSPRHTGITLMYVLQCLLCVCVCVCVCVIVSSTH